MSIVRMPMRGFLLFGLIALYLQSSLAHTYLSSVVLDGTALAEGDCVRSHPAVTYDNPILFVSSPNMTCGFLPEASEPANRKCPIAAGSSIGIQWHHINADASDDIIATSHKGPIIFYLAASNSGEGDVWFKIYEAGLDVATQTWATDTLIANDGLITITIPSDIAPGNYLLRGEVLALHSAYDLDGVQPYVGCVELTISGSGCAAPSGVAFPGAYVDTDPGLLYNIYYPVPLTSYSIPGPALYVPGTASCSSSSSSSSSTSGGSVPTASATHAPTNAPATQAPTHAPTNAPATQAPTHAPTNAPATQAPTKAPTTAPSNPSSGTPIGLQLWSGSSAWWFALSVTGGSQTTVKVEIMDTEDLSTWTALTLESWGAYELAEVVELSLPISVRLTSSSGAQVVVTNAFTSWTVTSVISTGQDYGSSSSSTPAPTHAPTTAPVTAAPTHAATVAPTVAPTHAATVAPTHAATVAPTHAATAAPTPSASAGSVSVTMYQSASQWWFAITVNGLAATQIASVQMKDAGSYTTYSALTNNVWGYSMNTAGAAFTAPVTVNITTTSGAVYTATVSSFTPGTVYSATA